MEGEQVFDEKYEYNCPQFVDFAMPQMNDDKADAIFDFDHEVGEPVAFEADQSVHIPDHFEEPSSQVEEVPSSQPDEVSPPPEISLQSACQEDVLQKHQEPTEQHDLFNNSMPDVVDTNSAVTPVNDEDSERTDAISSDGPTVVTDIVASTVEAIPDETEEDRIAEADREEELQAEERMCQKDDTEERALEEVEAEEMTRVEVAVSVPDETHASEMHSEVSPDDEQGETSKDTAAVADSEQNEILPREEEASHTEMTEGGVASPPAPSLSNIITSFDAPAHPVSCVPQNLVTSWGDDAKSKKNVAKETRSRPVTRRTTRSLNNDVSVLKRAAGCQNSQRRSLRIKHRASDSPAVKRRRVSGRSQGQGSAQKGKPMAGPPPSKPFVSKLTMPTTPTFMKRNLAKPGAAFKTTEQMEMERIADFRRQLAERKKQSQASYRMVQGSGSYHARKAAVAPTRPEGFVFETDLRVKEHPMATRQDASRSFAFEQNLRKGSSSPMHHHSGPRGPTVAKPFKFADNRKRKLEEGEGINKTSPYVSMATKISRFHHKTPKRFHTRRSGDHHDDTQGHQEPGQKPQLTYPKTPNLECRNRTRAVTVQSAAEKEEEEIQEMQSYKFKANPVNPRVMSNLNIGLKMASHREPTRPVGFNLESERRMKEREMKKAQEEAEEERRRKEEHYEFHARPIPAKMLEGPVGIAEVKARTLTCPKSPAFALKNRVRVKEDSIVEHEETKSHIVRANPVMHVGVPFRPQVSHKTTEAQPFSFEQRDRETKARKEAKIQEIYQEEEKARQFKAKPILDLVAMPEKVVKPVTKPEPFRMAIDEKAAKRAEQWSKKIEEELNDQRAKANQFKAKPADVLYNEPFIPQKPTKPLTEISGFDLNTDRRAGEREHFEQLKMKKELEARESRHRRDQLREEEERREVERMRREEMVHKAQPVKHFKPVLVHPSLRPLTEAVSPHFSDRFQK